MGRDSSGGSRTATTTSRRSAIQQAGSQANQRRANLLILRVARKLLGATTVDTDVIRRTGRRPFRRAIRNSARIEIAVRNRLRREAPTLPDVNREITRILDENT